MTTDTSRTTPLAPSPTTGSTDPRTWAMLAHLGALAAIFLSGIMGFVVPLVVLLIKGDTSPFVRRHAVASLNFQLTLLVVAGVGTIAAIVATILTLGLALLVILPAALAYLVFAVVVMIKATLRATAGRDYDYPLSLQLVR